MPKLFKTLALASIVICAPAALACPDDKQSHKHCDHKEGQCPYHNKKSWAETLSLQGEQAEKIDALEHQFMEKRNELKEAHHQAMKNLKAEQKAALEEVLSPEQAETLSQLHNKKHHKAGAHWEHKKHKQCPHKKASGA